ncbi:hypothetical protein [Dictyobacter arantiisoli]|uniref:Uncharacterized protein n=1 Tax=Dictyobacter arantiisoli TaxID=2014874 RepID=A0A5A5T7P9_9CHLR|nr:hypothetical protein [Dictyobacter arantiisoli]GCF07236.1 hypothetical protein KDI_08000 [Dictyobacter arantiisoli]
MKRRFPGMFAIICVLILVLVLLGIGTSAYTEQSTLARIGNVKAANTLAARIYLTHDALVQRFQQEINRQLPQLKKNAINNVTGGASASSQGWEGQLVNALIDPSVTLSTLTPESNGLNAGLTLSLYPGDSTPTTSHMLITFHILNGSNIQVSSQALPGSQALITGPITTLQVPIGTLTTIQTTPNCGDANLKLGLQLPLQHSQTQGMLNSTHPQYIQTIQTIQDSQTRPRYATLSMQTSRRNNLASQTALPAGVEIPFSSLSSLAAGIGTIKLNSSLEVNNIQLGIQNNQLAVTADIVALVFGKPTLKLGTTTTLIDPQALNGKLALHVAKTTLNVLIFSFPEDSYNQQIQQMLSQQVGNVLNGKFNVSAVKLGPDPHLPCAATDSMILTGTTTIN